MPVPLFIGSAWRSSRSDSGPSATHCAEQHNLFFPYHVKSIMVGFLEILGDDFSDQRTLCSGELKCRAFKLSARPCWFLRLFFEASCLLGQLVRAQRADIDNWLLSASSIYLHTSIGRTVTWNSLILQSFCKYITLLLKVLSPICLVWMLFFLILAMGL